MPPRQKAPLQNVMLEDCQLVYKNFRGEAKRFNQKGKRNFCVFLPEEIVPAMKKDGWNIRETTPREDGEEIRHFLKVNVHYSEKARPPRVVLITSRGKTSLGEDEIGALDWARITTVDLIFRPYERIDEDGKRTVTAWLNSIYVTIEEDELELKYGDMPDDTRRPALDHGPQDEEDPPF